MMSRPAGSFPDDLNPPTAFVKLGLHSLTYTCSVAYHCYVAILRRIT